MSRQINQKKEAFLASGNPFGSAGLVVPVAGVSSIFNYISQAHHLPAMQQHPGRARATHFCMKLRHYKILHSVPAPVFSPATFPSGVLIATRIKVVTPSCKPTAGRAGRLIRRSSVTVSPRQAVSACGSAGPLFHAKSGTK